MKEKKIIIITENIISLKSLFYRAIWSHIIMESLIPPAAFRAILCLKNGPLSMSEIGKQLCIPKPNVTSLIDKLIDNKLAERLSDKSDRRIIKIKLTNEGIHFIERNKKIFKDNIKRKLSSLTDKELDIFTDSLQNVKDTLIKISSEKN